MNLNQRRPLSSPSKREEKPTLSLCREVASIRGVFIDKYKADCGEWNERTVWTVNGRDVLVVMKGERANWLELLDAVNAA